jgi:hypothetical protein
MISTVAVAATAFGVGITNPLFSCLDQTLLPHSVFADSHPLVILSQLSTSAPPVISPNQFDRLRNTTGVLVSVRAFECGNGLARVVLRGAIGEARLPIREGRAFAADDRPGAVRVAMVNRWLARACWRGKSPVGRIGRLQL